MTELKLHVNSTVNTPNGPGTVQGRMIEEGKEILLVSHDPRDPNVAESIKEKYLTNMWVLNKYPVEQLS